MTLLLSTYLKKYNLDSKKFSDQGTRIYHVNTWREQIDLQLSKSKKYFPISYDKLQHSFNYFIDVFLQSHWDDIPMKIQKLDHVAQYYYNETINYSIAKSHKKPISSVLSYPFESSQSGVLISAYIVNDLCSIHENRQWVACDYLASLSNKTNIKSLKTNILNASEHGVLSTQSKQLIRRRVNNNQFHAEDHWFSVQMGQMINYLEEHRDTLSMSEISDDEIWIQQLNAPTRIEFVISSSPCIDCQDLFKNMRQLLNDKGLILPIIIFSNSTTNTSEVSHSQIGLIGFNGEFFNTKLVADTPYTRARLKEPNFIQMHGLFNRETQIFNNFESIISQVMPIMIDSRPKERNDFVDDLFRFFGHCDTIHKNALPWFVYFLNRLPNQFYTSQEMIADLSVDERYNVYEKALVSLPKNRVEMFLNAFQRGKIDCLSPTNMQGNHINREPQSFEYIKNKFILLIAPYIKYCGIRPIHDHIHSQLQSFYLKIDEESEITRASCHNP